MHNGWVPLASHNKVPHGVRPGGSGCQCLRIGMLCRGQPRLASMRRPAAVVAAYRFSEVATVPLTLCWGLLGNWAWPCAHGQQSATMQPGAGA